MIISITHKGLRKLWEENDASQLPAAYIEKIRLTLRLLDMNSPLSEISIYKNFRLHNLVGNMKEYWSVTVTGNYRIIFKIIEGDVHLVNFVDYH